MLLLATVTPQPALAQDKLAVIQGNLYGGDTAFDYDAIAFRNRVWKDGGVVVNMYYVDSMIKMLKWSGAWQNVVEVYSWQGGVKKDGSNLVSTLYGFKGKDLIATGTQKPTWSDTGIYFNGSTNLLKSQYAWNYRQPEFIFYVGKQISWTLGDRIFDGYTANAGGLYQSNTDPKITLRQGGDAATNSDFAINTFAILRVLFNGASSSIQVNILAATTGNPLSGNMLGFTLGAFGNNTNPSHTNAKDVILGNAAWNATIQGYIYNFLANKHGL